MQKLKGAKAINIECSAFDLLRWDKDSFYQYVKQEFGNKHGVWLDIQKMDIVCIRANISSSTATYKCIPVEYNISD